MKSGRFYGFYKPSVANGFPEQQYEGQGFNMTLAQCLLGTCREELTLKPQSVSELQGQLVTADFSNANFKKVFDRTENNVNFSFNPNIKTFRRMFRQDLTKEEADPIIFIYQPTMWMDRQAQDYQSVLKDYQEQFNFFYCADKEVVKEYFFFKDAPDVIPFVALIDPKKREPLKKQKNALEKVQARESLPLEEGGSQAFKTRKMIWYDKIESDLRGLIKEFMDDELGHWRQTEQRK